MWGMAIAFAYTFVILIKQVISEYRAAALA
jgi:hypothetical protein